MASDELVRYDVADGVATLTIDNPAGRNGWNFQLERQYFDLLERADRSPEVRVVVVTGAGKTFCPGLDMSLLGDLATSGDSADRTQRPTMRQVMAMRKPLIAAINGACAGIGLVHALFCDLRFAARGARLTTAFARRGLAPEDGICWVLPRIVGTDRALDLLLSGRVVDADEALALGLVTRVHEPDELLGATYEYAHMLARLSSPKTMMATRQQVISYWGLDFEAAEADSAQVMRQLNADNPDFNEGVASFVERRDPHFEPLPADLRLGGAG